MQEMDKRFQQKDTEVKELQVCTFSIKRSSTLGKGEQARLFHEVYIFLFVYTNNLAYSMPN